MADIATEGRSLVVVANKTDEVTPAQRHEVSGWDSEHAELWPRETGSKVYAGRASRMVGHSVPSYCALLGLQVVEMLQRRLLKQVPELAGAPVLPVSALTGSGADRLLPAVMAAYDVWTRRVPTSRLNRWLEKARHEGAALQSVVLNLTRCDA